MLTRRHKVMLMLERNPAITVLELAALSHEHVCNVRTYLRWATYSGAVKAEQPSGFKRYTVCDGWLAKLEVHESNPRVRAGDKTPKRNPERLQDIRVKELLKLAAAVNPSVKTAWVKPPRKSKPHHWHQASQGMGVAA